MSFTWRSEPEPRLVPIAAAGWALVVLRGAALCTVLALCLPIFGLIRLAERPLFGMNRPASPAVVQVFCRMALRIIGIGLTTRGTAMRQGGVIVANHASWLDIFTLNAVQRVCFVSKSEVARWPGVGFLARITGTLFINRDPREAQAQRDQFEARLGLGQRLLFFPEGTSTDGRRVLPFKSTLFAALFSEDLKPFACVQPVSVIYHAPAGADPRAYAWWGDMAFGAHFLRILATFPQGKIDVTFHPALAVADFADRKALAARCEAVVRSVFP